MAKNKQAKRTRKGKRPASNNNKGYTMRMTPVQQLLLDPCDGPLVSPYGGKRGYLTRFVQDFSLNTATVDRTAGSFAWFPGQLFYNTTQTGISSTPVAPSSTLGPGNAFCGTNASNVRCVAACVEVIASAMSFSNITGELGVAQINWADTSATVAVSADQLFQLCTSRAVITKDAMEIKWVPGQSDELYSAVVPGTSAAPPNQGVSGILVAYRGCPPGIALTFRVTAVLEWTARSNTGIPASNGAVAPSSMQEHVTALTAAKPDWWHNLTNSLAHTGQALLSNVAHDASLVGRKVAQMGMSRLAARAAPLLLGL